MTEDLFAAARRCLDAAAPDAKVSLTFTTAEAWEAGRLALESDLAPAPIAPSRGAPRARGWWLRGRCRGAAPAVPRGGRH